MYVPVGQGADAIDERYLSAQTWQRYKVALVMVAMGLVAVVGVHHDMRIGQSPCTGPVHENLRHAYQLRRQELERELVNVSAASRRVNELIQQQQHNHHHVFWDSTGTCPSSTMTLEMGIKRRLLETFPEIQDVVQVVPDAPEITAEKVEEILDGVRPFLSVAGGSVELNQLAGLNSLQPQIVLKMDGAASTLTSVRQEIAQRIQRTFMLPQLRVVWADDEVKSFKDW